MSLKPIDSELTLDLYLTDREYETPQVAIRELIPHIGCDLQNSGQSVLLRKWQAVRIPISAVPDTTNPNPGPEVSVCVLDAATVWRDSVGVGEGVTVGDGVDSSVSVGG